LKRDGVADHPRYRVWSTRKSAIFDSNPSEKGMPMKVLIACEFSGRVRDAFIKRGFDAMSCDLLPTESPGPHYQGDVFDIINDGWDAMIAFPPCTYLCNSGVRWLYEKKGRIEDMIKGALFFKKLLECDIENVCLENSLMHRYAALIIETAYSQIIHPWMFGHPESKTTCLWLRKFPELKPTKIVNGRYGRIHKMPPSQDRGKLRSIIYPGIADAMADQWGSYLKSL
jgi:hypothetical protein